MRKRNNMSWLLCVALCAGVSSHAEENECGISTQKASADSSPAEMRMAVVRAESAPVIAADSAEANGNNFEGGMVVKVSGGYRLFSTEHKGDVRTKLAEWSSTDEIHWKRLGTIFQSTGTQTGNDPRAALWSPMMVFDQEHQTWDMLYIGYFSRPNTKDKWYANYDGYVIRAVSERRGIDGIDGAYRDVDNLMRPSQESLPWEGLQGTDSFFPYKVGDHWMAFYGSANTEVVPCRKWSVGLASAPTISGPWIRCPMLSPSPIEQHFIENPIVYAVQGMYVAIYDVDLDDPHAIGYSFSHDGLQWSTGKRLTLQPGAGFNVRTPLGLIQEQDGALSLFYTASDENYRGGSANSGKVQNVYRATVRIEPASVTNGK